MLPRGGSLPVEVWRVRHRWVVTVLAVQVPCLSIFALVRQQTLGLALLAAALPALFAVIAAMPPLGRRARSAVAGLGLMMVSTEVVWLAGGATEAHFYYFVMIPVVALYEAWLPFALASAYVLVQHALFGTFNTFDTFDMQGHGGQRPWVTACIHAAFFAAGCLGSMAGWRIQEQARAVQQQLIADLAHQASHDVLTGLDNRASFLAAGERALAAAAPAGLAVAVLMIDLDRFKQINDILGHAEGDALLRQVGPRLLTGLRHGELLARLGGDEFAVLLIGLNENDAHITADRLRASLLEPFHVGGLDLDVDASIGVATMPASRPARSAATGGPGRTPIGAARLTFDDLLRQADAAMYAAKRGTSSTVVYNPHDNVDDRARLVLLSELRTAIRDNQLLLHFQPKLDLATGMITGAEALVRWQHPEHGLLPPGEFIVAAEVLPVIIALTDQVLQLAVSEARTLRDLGVPLQIAVNVAPRCLLDSALPGRVAELLRLHELPASALRIEITETSLIEDPQTALTQLNALHALGVSLSIDDFGTGYSSLDYLRRLPVDELKIDQTFTSGMLTTTDDAVIVRAAIDLGHNLGLTVVAEGVEDDAIMRALATDGCDLAQGYGIARPMSADQLHAWLGARLRARDHDPW